MKNFFKENWPFLPLLIIIIIAILLIGFAVVGDIYSYFLPRSHDINYQSDDLYNDNSLR